jgi:hypothetical protein
MKPLKHVLNRIILAMPPIKALLTNLKQRNLVTPQNDSAGGKF